MYKFGLNINDVNSDLTPTNGIDFGELSDLTGSLRKALDKSRQEKCFLSSIENHGYTPNFITESKQLYTRFIDVHTNIQEKEIRDLTKEEAKYAITLKRILSTDKYLQPLDKDNKPLLKLTSQDIDQVSENYNVITNKSGIVTEIGSPKLEDTCHIYLHNLDYKIYITSTQEEILKGYYRNNVLDLKLKQRRSTKTGKILNAILISFKVKSNLTFDESLKSISKNDLDFLKPINNIDDIITLIRS